MKACNVEGCNEKHYAKNRCRYHYVMPSKQFDKGFQSINRLSRQGQKPVEVFMLNVKPKEDKTIPALINALEIVFNRWIRNRDMIGDDKTHFICISCNNIKPASEADAGHYISKTYSALRFDEDNTHAECRHCNCYDDNHLIGYEVNLIKKIGLKRFYSLEARKHDVIKWDKQTILDLIKKYK